MQKSSSNQKALPSHFELMSAPERQQQIDVLRVLDSELEYMHKGAKVYQQHGNSRLFFVADRAAVRSENKLRISQMTEMDNKMKKQG